LESSTAKTVLFVDSDMILSPDLAREITECLAENDAAVIPEVSIGGGFWAKCKNLERRANSANPLFDAARCFRRSALLSIGKYDPNLEYGEDLDLQNRAIARGLRIGRIKAIILHDEGDLSLESIIRKKYLYGKTLGGYLERNPRGALEQMNPLKGIVSPSLKVFKSTPRYGIGILIMKSIEWAAAGLGYLVHNRGHSASGIS
jgi:arabinofuranan 3-O-arabinosyltransferase